MGPAIDHAELFREIRRIELFTRRLVNDHLAGQYQSVFKGRGMAFDEVRQYQIGDDVRLIDWNVSARMNDVYIKLFAEERELTVMLLVDISASGSFGTTHQTKARLMAKVAATLAFSAIKNNDRVGLILFSDRVEAFVPPKKGRKHVLRVVSEILRFRPKGKRTSVRCGLEFLGRVAKHRVVAFLVSDFIDQGYDTALRLMATKHDLVPICVSDPAEHELPALGLVYAEDPETGGVVLVDTADRKVRQTYSDIVKRQKAEREQLLRRLKIDYVDLSTADMDLTGLQNFFALRARRARRV